MQAVVCIIQAVVSDFTCVEFVFPYKINILNRLILLAPNDNVNQEFTNPQGQTNILHLFIS